MQTTILIEKNQHLGNEIESKGYDFIAIRAEYVEGLVNDDGKQIWPTMKKLSMKHGVPFAYLRRIAALQHWTAEKQNYITNYEHAKQEEKIKFLAQKATKFDNRCIKIAEEGIKKIETLICNTLDGVRINEQGEEVPIPMVGMEELEVAAKTLEKFQKIGRLALGSSTDNISKSIKSSDLSIPFSTGMDVVMKQIESNPELNKQLEDEIIDD